MMRYLSVCSGIEAASVAWRPLGWEAVAFSEIESFPSALLAHHYPDVPNWGDMTAFKEWLDATVNILVGGTPCQSFSVAGLRKGLDDPRGSLMLTYLAIADRYRPRWLVWENVPGVLSSNGGRDFGSLLGGLGQLGYGWAYRILDAQYFGVAQRRRRVFVVGCFGNWRAAAAVLFERHSVQGHPAPSRKARERVANCLTDRADRGGTNSEGQRLVAHCHDVAPTLNAAFASKQGLEDQHIRGGGGCSLPPQAQCLTTKTGMRYDPETETLIPTTGGVFNVAHSLRAEGFDASEDGTGRGTPIVPVNIPDVACTMKSCKDSGGWSNSTDHAAAGYMIPLANSLAANSGRMQVEQTYVPVPFDTTQITSAANYSNPKPGDPCHPLASGAHAPAVAFGWQNSSQQGASASASVTPTLDKSKVPGVGVGMQVRRLTPRECERLQGFPDDYTLIPYRNKPAADGPRYKALGNSMAVPVMAWIGRRIQQVEAITNQEAAA